MGHYVYRYMHPDYPWLYVGKTDNSLETRIRTHNGSNSDNISRDYKELLLESTVYYIELENSLQTTYVEKLLIDKYKPYLNKLDKIDQSNCPIEFGSLHWKKFVPKPELPVIKKNKDDNKQVVVVEKVLEIEKPSYKLTKKEEKEQSYLDFYRSGYYDYQAEIESIFDNGTLATEYNKDIYKLLFQPNASEFINYNKRNRNSSDKQLHFWGVGYNLFGEPIYFRLDGSRAFIGKSPNEYSDSFKVCYTTAEGFKELIHIMKPFGGVFGVSKRDYELFLEYYKTKKEEIISGKVQTSGNEKRVLEKYDEKIKELTDTIKIIEESNFENPLKGDINE